MPDAKDWLPALLAAIAVLGAALITLRGRAGPSRPREDALKEQELLSKLDPDSDEAKQLREVLRARVASWHASLVPQSAPVAKSRSESAEVRFAIFWYVLSGLGVLLTGVVFLVLYNFIWMS